MIGPVSLHILTNYLCSLKCTLGVTEAYLKTLKPIKDESNEHLIPTSWRAMLIDVINSFVAGDFLLGQSINFVKSVDNEIALASKAYVADYGEILTVLSDETWETSCAQWMEGYWDIIVDLRTEVEDRSDMIFTGKVSEANDNYVLDVGLIYVP